MNKPSKQRTALVGLVAGTLAVPVLVFASSAVFGVAEVEPQQESVVLSATEAQEPAGAPIAGAASPVGRPDLERACGPDGLDLVAREADGSIGDLEKAALDALRPICEDVGLALPAQPSPPVVAQTIEAAVPAVITADEVLDADDDQGRDDEPDDSADSWDDSDESADSWADGDDSAES